MLRALLVFATSILVACTPDPANELDEVARQYLFLELSMGNIDSAHVDAYFGPPEIKALADESALDLQAIRDAGLKLAESVSAIDTADDTLLGSRKRTMLARLRALDTRIDINQQEFISFDEEAAQLFGTVPPQFDAAHFDSIVAKIEALLPGAGALAERVDAFRNEFAIPADRLEVVFDAAIAECRRRTLQHIKLADNESFTVEYVTDKPWSGYNWYQGDAVSLIQINTDLPIFISRAVDLGCHEGYPGHHTYNALLEQDLVKRAGWLEFSLYPLFSPQSVIAEGSGNYGIKLAFPGNERIEFEKQTLFPLAGLSTDNAERYYSLQELLAELNYSGNEAARAYLNGDMTREQAIDWLMRYSLNSKPRAEQRTRFFDAYRSYVINYNHGLDLVAGYIERGDANDEKRWARFEALLSQPLLPADLED